MSLLQEIEKHGLADCEFNRKLLSKFEVQHFTLCDGWVNTWHEYDNDNNEVPMIFDAFGDALLELDNFLADEIKAYNMGDIESPYDINEFRIVELQELTA